MKTLFIAADKIIDGKGSFKKSDKILKLAEKQELEIRTLSIVPLSRPWNSKLAPYEFKSGAAVAAAIAKARRLLQTHKADLVVIEGKDLLKTGYDKKEREEYMKFYEGHNSPLDGYNELTKKFLEHFKISESHYFQIREELFQNLLRTWKKIDKNNPLPHERWYQPLTYYFRGVDCANPNIDYEGRIILCTQNVSNRLKIPLKERTEIIGNASIKLKVDGMASIPHVASYKHLKKAIHKAQEEAKIDFKKLFLKEEALLDVYTCYPVVPMGFLLSLSLIKRSEDFIPFLRKHPITVTGGLNLSRAAWNLTSLNALIDMRTTLQRTKKPRIGLVHGNGSLGNQQGITILKKA